MEKRKISSLKGIGEKTEKLFQKIGVDTVEDLIRYYPKGFEIFEAVSYTHLRAHET